MDLYQPCIISADQPSTNNVNQPSTSNVNQQNTSSTMQLSTSNAIQTNRKSYSSLTLQQKLEVLKLKDAGASTNYLAIRYKVDESTIRKWIREREKLEKYSSLSAESKRVRLSPVEKVNEALTIWFHREKKLNRTVSVTDVKAKAHEFFKRFGGMESFKASDGC
nr:PREDICTED: uncharacterized protein LOC105661767 [Megachile rotundata]